jgi:hypothetical protein
MMALGEQTMKDENSIKYLPIHRNNSINQVTMGEKNYRVKSDGIYFNPLAVIFSPKMINGF